MKRYRQSDLNFKIEDYVKHKTAGYSGKVVGLGYEVMDGVYQKTLKVCVVDGLMTRRTHVLEDLVSEWVLTGKS